MSPIQQQAYLKLMTGILGLLLEDAELRTKACGDFLMVDVFSVLKDESIYVRRVCFHYEDGKYVTFEANMNTDEGFQQLVRYVEELYAPHRQLSFIAELLNINLSDMSKIMTHITNKKRKNVNV